MATYLYGFRSELGRPVVDVDQLAEVLAVLRAQRERRSRLTALRALRPLVGVETLKARVRRITAHRRRYELGQVAGDRCWPEFALAAVEVIAQGAA